MRQHGITDIDTKQKRFFTEKNLFTGMSLVCTARQNGKTVALTGARRLVAY
jgi:hypothetical protein